MEEKRCIKCGLIKPLSEYYFNKNHADGYASECKVCVNIKKKINHAKNKQNNTDGKLHSLIESNIKKQCAMCLEVKPVSSFCIKRTTVDGFNSYCSECWSKYKSKLYHKHKDLPYKEYRRWRNMRTEQHMREKRRLKIDVFSHYCPDGIIKCANPFHLHNDDITDLDILSLDHINGDGYKYRNKITHNGGGITYYRFVKTHGYPSGLQVLCFNCQMKKKFLNKEYGEKYKTGKG